MELRLSAQEHHLLLEILEDRQKNLIHEIDRTDHREFKHELQARYSLIDDMIKRMKALEAAA